MNANVIRIRLHQIRNNFWRNEEQKIPKWNKITSNRFNTMLDCFFFFNQLY